MECQATSEIGRLPEELMLIIVRLTSLQASASLWMASKFWHEKLKRVFEHPKILFVSAKQYSIYRSVFMLNNGIAYEVAVKFTSERRIMRAVQRPRIAVKHGWFDNISALEEFLSEFNRIMANNTKIPDSAIPVTYAKVKPKNTPPTFYTSSGVYGSVALGEQTVGHMSRLIENAKIVLPEPEDRSSGVDGIALTIHGKIASGNSVWAHLFVHSNGDINLRMWTASALPVNYDVRSSPEVFTQLEQIIVYSKHTKSIPILDERPYRAELGSIFDMYYMMNGKTYIIQECVVPENGQQAIRTNNYKTSSIKKIMKVLDSVLFNKSIKLPLSGVTPASPLFAGHQLIRMPHFRMPTDEDFPAVVAIKLTVKATAVMSLELNLSSNVPLVELLALFREVANSLNSEDTKACELAVKVSQGVVIQSVEVMSFKAVKAIKKLPKELLVKVWDMMVRIGIYKQ